MTPSLLSSSKPRSRTALETPLPIRDWATGMEHLWSPAGATSGNRWQMGRPRKPLKQRDPQPVATHGNRFGAHGKEGVDGSSPSEGSTKDLRGWAFPYGSTCIFACTLSSGALSGAFRLKTLRIALAPSIAFGWLPSVSCLPDA
jgi:hypothetical protein